MTERLHFHFSPSCIGEGNGNPLQCSCLESPRDGGATRAAVYGVAQSQTRLKQLSSSSSRLYSSWNSPGQNTGVGSLSLLQGNLPYPGIEPRSSTLQADSLPAEPQGKPKNTGVGSLSFLQWIFLIQEWNHGLLHCRQILYQLSYQGSPILPGEPHGQRSLAGYSPWGCKESDATEQLIHTHISLPTPGFGRGNIWTGTHSPVSQCMSSENTYAHFLWPSKILIDVLLAGHLEGDNEFNQNII